MSNPRFHRFLAAAKRGRPTVESAATFGFTTRVVARWTEGSRRVDPWSLWERFARYGALLVAALLLLLAVALPPPPATEPEYLLILAQPALDDGRPY